MKVLYLTPVFWPDTGGIEVISARHVLAFQERGYDFIVLTSHCKLDLPDETEYHGIPVHRLPMITALANRNLRQMLAVQQQVANIKRTYKPDLIHVNFGGPAPICYYHLRTADVRPAPALVTMHDSARGLNGSPDTILGQLLRAGDWVTAGSATMLNDARQVVPKISDRSSVVHWGLPTPAVEPAPLPTEEPRVLCLGRLVDDKGFDLAITAFASLIDRYPQARLIIAGDGPARSALMQQAFDLGLAQAVKFTGKVPVKDMPELFNKATIVVMPSRWREGFGLVALEAAQMARPVVAARAGGLSEAVAHERTGLLVEEEDSAALAKAIAFLLDNPEKARQMGQAGRARALDLFDWDKYVDAYDKLYHKLVQESNDAPAAIGGFLSGTSLRES